MLPGSGSGPLTPCRAMLIAENSRMSATLSGVHMLLMCCDAPQMHTNPIRSASDADFTSLARVNPSFIRAYVKWHEDSSSSLINAGMAPGLCQSQCAGLWRGKASYVAGQRRHDNGGRTHVHPGANHARQLLTLLAALPLGALLQTDLHPPHQTLQAATACDRPGSG